MAHPRPTTTFSRFLGASALLAAMLGMGCASARLPPLAVRQEAWGTAVLRARLKVHLKGPDGRGRTTVLVGFARPDALRLEIPGPTGARVVVVAHGADLTAVFPSERAVYRGGASAADVEAVLGVGLAPGEIMDLLVGAPPPRVASARVWWGERLPKRVKCTLPDGTRLDVRLRDVDTPGALPAAAFREPAHAGFRLVGADEARELWTR